MLKTTILLFIPVLFKQYFFCDFPIPCTLKSIDFFNKVFFFLGFIYVFKTLREIICCFFFMDCLLVRSFAAEGFLVFSFTFQLLFNSFLIKKILYNFPVLNKEFFLQIVFIFFCLLVIMLAVKLDTFFYNFLFINNASIYLYKIIFVIFSIAAIIIIYRSSIIQFINELEFFSILLLIVFSSFLLLSSFDLLSIYLALEMQSLCFYALASFKKNSSASVESGLKYFILGSVVSCFFLFGVSILYGCFGTVNLNDLLTLLFINIDNDFTQFNYIVFYSCFILICVFFFKISAFPFHWWSPDVYEGAPLSSTIVFILLPKIIFFSILVKIILIFSTNFYLLKDFCLISGILTVFLGSVFAIQQSRLKRFFIFTSVAQVGFLVAVLATKYLDGYTFLFFFLMVYLVSSIIIWCFYNVLLQSFFYVSTFLEQPSSQIYLLSLTNLIKKNKFWSFSFFVVFFSLAGIPPFGGFLAKLFILFELLKNHYFFSITILILISAISVYYYIRTVKILFFEPVKESLNSFSIVAQNFIISFEYLLISFGLILISSLFLYFDIFLLFAYRLIFGLLG